MKQNNSFSLNRLMGLIIQSLIVNKRLLAISVAGVAGTICIILMFFQRNMSYNRWDQSDYMIAFLIFFLFVGILWTGQSFPAFRSKEKSLVYLMVPAARSEKFIMELITRIVAFIIFMPILFWIVANAEGALVHHYKPKLEHYSFSFSQGWAEFTKNWTLNKWIKFQYIFIYLFFLIASFTGACHYSKSPLAKTVFTFIVIITGYFVLIYLLVKGLKIDQYFPYGRTFLPLHNKGQAEVFFAIAALIVNLTLLVVAWFRFKEREA